MPNEVDIHAGKTLRELRRSKNISQEALGKAAGVTFQQIQKYERGSNRMSASRLQQFADVLGVEPAIFFPKTKKIKNAHVPIDVDRLHKANDELASFNKTFKKIFRGAR